MVREDALGLQFAGLDRQVPRRLRRKGLGMDLACIPGRVDCPENDPRRRQAADKFSVTTGPAQQEIGT